MIRALTIVVQLFIAAALMWAALDGRLASWRARRAAERALVRRSGGIASIRRDMPVRRADPSPRPKQRVS